MAVKKEVDPVLEAAKAEQAKGPVSAPQPETVSAQPAASVAGHATTVEHTLASTDKPLVPTEVKQPPPPPAKAPVAAPVHPKDPKDAPFAPMNKSEMVHTAVVSDEDDTTLMLFPVPVTLTLDHHAQLKFAAGVQKVPDALVNHPYLKAHGVKSYDAASAPRREMVLPSRDEFVASGYKAENYDAFVASLKKG